MTMTVHLQKVGNAWVGTINESNRTVTGVAIDDETTAQYRLDTFNKAVSFIKGTRPNWVRVGFFEVK